MKLTLEKLTGLAKKQGISINKKSNYYEVTFNSSDKVYSYKANNLLDLAQRLKIKDSQFWIYKNNYNTVQNDIKDLEGKVNGSIKSLFGSYTEEMKEEMKDEIEVKKEMLSKIKTIWT